MTRLAVLDFGMGNLRSVAKALERAGADVEVVAGDVPGDVDGLVVPGQGHFGACVVNLGERAKQVVRWIEADRPYLGICLGLQVLFDASEEAQQPGLGVFAGPVRRFGPGVKIPHIGWNVVTPSRPHALFDGIDPGSRFYFVHSYFPAPSDAGVTLATTDYGDRICVAAARDAVVATQFHPEKSGDAGIALLRNFVGLCEAA